MKPGDSPSAKRSTRRRKPRQQVRAAPRTEHIPAKRLAPPPPRPSRTQLARTQEAQYVSQGRAVKRAAAQQQQARKVARAKAQEKAYVSQGRQVAKAAKRPLRAPKPDRGLVDTIVAALHPRNIYGSGGKGQGSRAAAGGITSASTAGVAGGLPGRVVRNMGAVIAEKPSVLKQVPGDLTKWAIGAPAGLAETVADPGQAVKNTAGDYSRRYSGSDKAMRQRMLKEGITPELLDLSTGATGGGAVVGRALQKAAVRAPAGSRVRKIATERPNIRVSGNVSRPQDVSPNFFRNVARARVDRTRAAQQRRRARSEDAPLETRLAQERGEVTYAGVGAGPVRTSGRKRAEREQRILVAREKGTTLARFKAQQQKESGEARKALNSLSKEEQRGFAFALQFGATTPQAARRLAQRRRADIATHREGRAQQNPDYEVSGRRDQLPELKWLEDNADKAFTPKLRQVVRQEQARERRISTGDPGVDPTQAQLRRYQPVAAALGIQRAEGEGNAQYLRRVNRVARGQGLERPGYIRSEERSRGVFSTFALGGRKATDIPKAYSGSLMRQGIESMDPEVHIQGVARGIKRREQWNLVARNFERHAVDKVRGKTMRNRDMLSLTRDLENAGVDLSTVAFWNPRKFYAESAKARRDREGSEVEGDDREFGEAARGDKTDLQRALEQSVVSGTAVRRSRPEDFDQSKGWSVVPAEVLRELEADTRASGVAGRAVDISRGKISRVLLGNPAWLTFQVASNAFLTGLAGVGPVDVVKAQRWWKKLPDEQKQALAPELGITGWYDEQTRLGATANNRMVNSYRALKKTGLYQKLHKGNPFDALFRVDQAQNNFFRKAVFYNEAKREAYRRMGDNATRMMRAQQGVQRVLKMDPKDRITAAAKEPRAFEHHARAVRDFLGDYTSYTAKERRTLGRYMLFYGFLRHSLRLTFYTLPVKHPMISAIGLELGKMHDDELQRIFGVDPPTWEQANAFIGGKKFDVGRLNPFFNAAQYSGPGSLLMLGSPLLAMTADQVASKNVAFDQPYRVKGSGSYVTKGSDIGSALQALVPGTTRNRILLSDVANLSPYYRYAAEQGIPGVAKPLRGKQTDESSLLFPDPITYKTEEPAARNQRRIAEQEAESTRQRTGRYFFPVAGEPSAPTVRSSREYAESQGEDVAGSAAPLTDAQRRALRRAQRSSRRAGGGNAATARALARARRAAQP